VYFDAKCLDFVCNRLYPDKTRIRDAVSEFLYDVCESTLIEIWSRVFDKEKALYTDVFHSDAGVQINMPYSSVLTEEQVCERSIGKFIINVPIEIPKSAGNIGATNIIVVFQSKLSECINNIEKIKHCLKKIIRDCLRASIRNAYEMVVVVSQKSDDLHSLLHKINQNVLIDDFKFEASSIFYFEKSTNSLILGATTGIEKQKSHFLKKSDIYYFSDSKSFTAVCWRKRQEIIENVYKQDPLKKITLGEEIGKKMYSRVYLPICRWSEPQRLGKSKCIGVIRAVNSNTDANFHPLTVIEVARLRIVIDAVAVLVERYAKAQAALFDQDRAIHGYVTDLGSIAISVQNIEKWLSKLEPDKASSDVAKSAYQEIVYRTRDIASVQDNMASQIMTVIRTVEGFTVNEHSGGDAVCRLPFRDIILRVHAARRSMSSSFYRNEIKITYNGEVRADDDFSKIPSLSIPNGAIYHVFRNLVENSIKYALPESTPELDIKWRVDDKYIYFNLKDCGIGIPGDEQKYVFRERFRGSQAKYLALRGSGLGLASSKKILNEFGGDLIFIAEKERKNGTTFVVKVPLHKGIS